MTIQERRRTENALLAFKPGYEGALRRWSDYQLLAILGRVRAKARKEYEIRMQNQMYQRVREGGLV